MQGCAHVPYLHHEAKSMKKKLKVPKFKNEKAERRFWECLDLSVYFEQKDFCRIVFPNLKKTLR